MTRDDRLQRAEKEFWDDVKSRLGDDPRLRGREDQLVDTYRKLLRDHDVDERLVHHRGAQATAHAVAQQLPGAQPAYW